MAWLYPDFDTAFADWEARYVDYQSEMFDTKELLAQALAAGFTATGFTRLRQAVQALFYAVRYIAGDDINTWEEGLYNNLMYYAGKGGVDMQGMIDALFDGEYLQYADWLGIQWAIQQTLWDQPFFPEKYQDIINRIRT